MSPGPLPATLQRDRATLVAGLVLRKTSTTFDVERPSPAVWVRSSSALSRLSSGYSSGRSPKVLVELKCLRAREAAERASTAPHPTRREQPELILESREEEGDLWHRRLSDVD